MLGADSVLPTKVGVTLPPPGGPAKFFNLTGRQFRSLVLLIDGAPTMEILVGLVLKLGSPLQVGSMVIEGISIQVTRHHTLRPRSMEGLANQLMDVAGDPLFILLTPDRESSVPLQAWTQDSTRRCRNLAILSNNVPMAVRFFEHHGPNYIVDGRIPQ